MPGLAHAWDSNAEATEWTFYLRKGVRFHHGRELTSEDVRFTLERLNGDKLHSWMVRSVIRTEVCEIENYHQQGNYLRECLHPEMLGWAEQQINLALPSGPMNAGS